MPDPKDGATDQDPRVKAALEDYLDRVDRGETVDRDRFLEEHHEIADELRSFLATEREFEQLAAPDTQPPPAADRPDVSTQSMAEHGQETMIPQRVQQEADSTGSGTLPPQFGRYRVLKPLGSGAMGTVYLAEDTQLERQVALKTPSFDEANANELLERFYREARSAATLRHTNICPVYDVGEIDGRHYISMAYIKGRPLSAYIQPDHLPSERNTLLIVRKIALGLHEAHKHGIIHRDLKPGNVMIDEKGEPIIMDFGLARKTSNGGEARLTQSGMIVGSPAYMSPEQVQGEPDQLTPAADQYSLGVILYEMLTGQLPFRGSITAVIGAILTKQPTPIEELRKDLDPRIVALCERMMHKEAEHRFPSLRDVANEIRGILSRPAAGQEASAAKPQAGKKKNSTSPKKTTAATASITASNVSSLLEAARKSMRKHDYEGVVQLLETLPERKRTDEANKLLAKARGLADEVAFLIAEIEEADRLNDNEALAKKADELLELKPRHHRALQIKEELKRYGRGRLWKAGGWTPDGRRIGEGSWIPWIGIAVALVAFGLTLWAVTIYLRGNNKLVKIEIDEQLLADGDVTLHIDEETVTIAGIGETINLEPGEYDWELTRGDELIIGPREFVVREDGSNLLKISINDDPPTSASPDEWIDVIPLIDPQRDRFDLLNGGANEWVVRNGELSVRPDDKAAKILFPLILDGPSLEWEIVFTKTSGTKVLTTDIPAIDGVVPVAFRDDEVRVEQTPEHSVIRGPCVLQEKQRKTARIRVERNDGLDKVEVFVDGDSIGEWTGDRQTIRKSKLAGQDYRTDQRTGLYVGGSTAYTFHRIRLRMLEGEARLLETTNAPRQAAGVPTWTDLVNGRDLTGWVKYSDGKRPTGWRVEEGALHLAGRGGDIMTVDAYSDFELEFEWKISQGGNSGVIYRVDPGLRQSWHSGPEYQLLDDDRHPNGNQQITSAGAIYGIAAPQDKTLRPVGQWNTARIIARGNHLEHWLNGVKVVEAEIGSDDWNSAVSSANVRDKPQFAKSSSGHIVLQDHGKPVWFRNMRIRVLESSSIPTTSDRIELFNGRDFAGWRIEDNNAAAWKVIDGTIVTEGEGKGYLFTEERFSDFELSLEYRLQPGANSGVYLRAPRRAQRSQQAIEVALLDNSSLTDQQRQQNPEILNGALHGLVGPTADPAHTDDRWNTLLIRAVGPRLSVDLNGQRIQNVDLNQLQNSHPNHPGLKRTSGWIALQHWSPARAQFRKIRIRPLAPPTVPGSNQRVSSNGVPFPRNGQFTDARRLDELYEPRVVNAYPWISPDGLTLYWTRERRDAGSAGSQLRQAARPSPGEPFRGALTILEDARFCSLSSDELEVVCLFDADGDGQNDELGTSRRPTREVAFPKPKPIESLKNVNKPKGTTIGSDGLSLFVLESGNVGQDIPTTVLLCRRADPGDEWGPPEQVSVNGQLPADRWLTHPALDASGDHLLISYCLPGTRYQEWGGVADRTEDPLVFANSRPLLLDGERFVTRGCRYCAATGELFYTQPKGERPYREMELWVARSAASGQIRKADSNAPIEMAVWSPDGSQIATAGWDGAVRLWDAATLALQRELTGHERATVGCIYVAGDSSRMISLSRGGQARLWDTNSGRELSQIDFGREAVYLSRSMQGDRFFVGLSGGVVESATFTDGTHQRLQLKNPGRLITNLDPDPSGQIMLYTSYEGTVCIYDSSTWNEVRRFTPPQKARKLRISPDGKFLAVGADNGSVFVYDTDEWTEVWRADSHQHAVTSLTYSPDGQHLISGSSDWSFIVWDAASGRQGDRHHPGQGWVTTIDYSPDGRNLLVTHTGREGESLQVWTIDAVLDRESAGQAASTGTPTPDLGAAANTPRWTHSWKHASAESILMVGGLQNDSIDDDAERFRDAGISPAQPVSSDDSDADHSLAIRDEMKPGYRVDGATVTVWPKERSGG